MMLDDKERLRFIEYLEFTALTCKGMAVQFSKMPGGIMCELEKREKLKAGACLLIANDLKNAEGDTI